MNPIKLDFVPHGLLRKINRGDLDLFYIGVHFNTTGGESKLII